MPARALILVHPPQQGLLEGFSSGLIALANFVHDRAPGVDVSLLDLGVLPPAAAREAIRTAVRAVGEPLVVGIATTTASYQDALRVARAFKEFAPECCVVMGGHHATPQDEVILRHHTGTVDAVLRGEGERGLLALVERFPHLDAVPGLSRLHDGALVRSAPAPLLSPFDLDTIGVTFRGGGIRSAPGKFDHVTYVSARGCPLGCHFCAVANETVRAKSVRAVAADLAFLVAHGGFRRVAIEDNFFAQNRARTLELCDAIARLQRDLKEPFAWDCQTRVESMQHAAVLQAMERAGCEAVYLGVEAVDPDHLIYLGKTPDPGRYLQLLLGRVVPMLLGSTVAGYLNLQLGIPGETAVQVERTLAVVGQLGALAAAAGKTLTLFPQLHVVYPGTRHFHDAMAQHRFGPRTADVFEAFTAWEAEQEPVRTWLGEHFAHGTGGIPEGILVTEHSRRGEFHVDPDAVLRVTNTLSAMQRLPGIRVFQYGTYLARSRASDDEARRAG